MKDEEFDLVINQLAEMALSYDAMREAGAVSEADFKAFQASQAEIVQALDEERGTSDVTYRQFRQALEAGFECDVLVKLKNGMDPKDPLRDDAVKDLRSIGCSMATSKRRRPR